MHARPDTFTLVNCKLADSIADFHSKPAAAFSDHLPMHDSDSIVMSWNTLQRCTSRKAVNNGEVTVFNNGFCKVESEDDYRTRTAGLLAWLTHEYVSSVNNSPGQAPVKIICLQEMEAGEDDIEKHLSNGFRIARLGGKPGSISHKYAKQCQLVMLHSADVEPVEKCDLSSLNLVKAERYQAVRFRHAQTKTDFIVVNVHQDWAAVERGDKPGLGNLKLIQKLFAAVPCIITGDFNTSNMPLDEEAGKLIRGENTNLVCASPLDKVQESLGACDHIILNQCYCSGFLPALRPANAQVKAGGLAEAGETLFARRQLPQYQAPQKGNDSPVLRK